MAGDRIVCVESAKCSGGGGRICKGRVYTIRSIVACPVKQDIGFRVDGVTMAYCSAYGGIERAWSHGFFRPVDPASDKADRGVKALLEDIDMTPVPTLEEAQ
jgi:hypothetical protein